MHVPRSRHPELPLLFKYIREIDQVLGEHVDRGSRVAFVNFPNISNVGDLLLWMGTRATLRRLGIRIGYVAEPATYDPDGINGMSRCDAILINGGGNFGDLWQGQQQVRERVLVDFPTVPTIQLPQSLHFQDPSKLSRMQDLLAGHSSFTGLWRERQSFSIAQEELPGRHRECPDLALGLGPVQGSNAASTGGIRWLARADQESLHPPPDPLPSKIDVTDWVDPTAGAHTSLPARLAFAVNARTRRELGRGHSRGLARIGAAAYPWMARHHVRRGVRLLEKYEVVVTDRLHAHILALLMGIPNVVLDNSYGKVRGVYDRWTGRSQLAHWADNTHEAVRIARGLRDIPADPRNT